MKIATLRDFRDHASEMMRSKAVILVTRDGKPAGFFVPWDRPDIPDEIRKGLYQELSERVSQSREELGVTEEEIVADFQAARRARR